MPTYDLERTALLLIGYQNDYFAEDGILVGALEDTEGSRRMLEKTSSLLEVMVNTPVSIVSTPIQFTPDYSELIMPTGILEVIRDQGAFKENTKGCETISELTRYEGRISEIPGKRGLNAFSNTDLDEFMKERGIVDVVLGGVVTSVCIDSTGRSAHERGYRVSVLSDCTAGRTQFEQEFYCDKIFPLYAHVIESEELKSIA